MEKKLYFIVDDGEHAITVPEHDLINICKFGFDDYDANTNTADMPVYTVSPIYMTQEEFDAMPEFNG